MHILIDEDIKFCNKLEKYQQTTALYNDASIILFRFSKVDQDKSTQSKYYKKYHTKGMNTF